MKMNIFKLLFFLLAITQSHLMSTQQKLPKEILEQLGQNKVTGTVEESEKFKIEDHLNTIDKDRFDRNELDLEINIENKIFEKKVFGVSFFDSQSVINNPVLDVPLPSNYRVSFGDKVRLILAGTKDESYELRVSLGGEVLIPEIGSVQVYSLSLLEAQERVQKIVSERYINTNVSFSVTEPSLKKVTIIGSVRNPGTYLVNPFISVSEALKYAGGLLDNASIRNIKIEEISGQQRVVDLYDFLVFGKRGSDINLQSGDTIIVPATQNRVEILGAVHRPMVYEYKIGDKVSDLIEFAQGSKYESDLDNLYLKEIIQKKLKQRIVSLDYEIINPISSIFLPSTYVDDDSDIFVSGDPLADGFYDSTKYTTVFDFVSELEFSKDIYPFYFVLNQSSSNGLGREVIELNLTDADLMKSIELKENIKINFFTRKDMEKFNFYANALRNIEENIENLNKSIEENERATFEIELLQLEEEKKKLLQSDRLNDDRIFSLISRRQNTIISFDNYFIETPIAGEIKIGSVVDFFGASSSNNFENISVIYDNTLIINGYNSVVPKGEKISSINLPDPDLDLISVSINGQIKYPGTYKVGNQTTLEDLYAIAGGFTENSNTEGINLSRVSVKKMQQDVFFKAKEDIIDGLISIVGNPLRVNQTSGLDFSFLTYFETLGDIDSFPGRVAGDLTPGSTLSRSILLEDGDEIIVPSKSVSVAVIGEVFDSKEVEYTSSNYKSYVNQAGGYTDFADKNSVYIAKANGLIIKDINRYEIMPGDSIIVPRDIDKLSAVPLISVAASVISDLALSAASLNVLNN